MPKNSVIDTRNPAMVATFIELLRAYSAGEAAQGPLEERVWAALQENDPNRQITGQQIARFDNIQDSTKARVFGDLGGANLRARSQPEMEQIFAVPGIALLMEDDVGPVIVPSYPRMTQFFIEYTGLYCRDNTGDRFIFGGNDEVYIVTAVVNASGGNNEVTTVTHPLGDPAGHYSGLNDGRHKRGPTAACWTGRAPTGDLSLVVAMMERDEGDPDAFEDEIRVIVAAAAAIAAIFNIAVGAAILAFARDAIKWLVDSADDSIGTVVEVISPDRLKIVANNPTQDFKKTRNVVVPTGPFSFELREVEDQTDIPHHIATRHRESGEYFAMFRLRASMPPDQQPQADQGLVLAGRGTITL